MGLALRRAWVCGGVHPCLAPSEKDQSSKPHTPRQCDMLWTRDNSVQLRRCCQQCSHLLCHLSEGVLHHASRRRVVFWWSACNCSDTKTLCQLFGICIHERLASLVHCLIGQSTLGSKTVRRRDSLLDCYQIIHALAMYRRAPDHHAQLDFHHQEWSSSLGDRSITSQGCLPVHM